MRFLNILPSAVLLLPALSVVNADISPCTKLAPLTSDTPSPSFNFDDTAASNPPAVTGSPDPARLDLREIVNAATTRPVTQAPAETTVGLGLIVDGVYSQVWETYTQLFSKIPDQGPSPQAGTIGLGTIVGTVGVVKSKRDASPEPTPAAAPAQLEAAANLFNELHHQRVKRSGVGKVEVAVGGGGAIAFLAAVVAAMLVV